MALIVETGSIVAGAESYISVSDADTFHSNRANTAWADAQTSEKEAALRKATDHIEARYGQRWQGAQVNPNVQPLSWPRVDVIVNDLELDNTSIPSAIKRACAEYALRALSGDLVADTERGGMVASESVGPISTSYFQGAPAGRQFPAIDRMLSPFLKAGSGGGWRNAERG